MNEAVLIVFPFIYLSQQFEQQFRLCIRTAPQDRIHTGPTRLPVLNVRVVRRLRLVHHYDRASMGCKAY